MKRILILFLASALIFTVCPGQSYRMATTAGGSTLTSTNTNATVTYLYVAPLKMPAPAWVSLQYVGTKSSGFIKGSITLQGSIDGTNYSLIATDSLTLANATTNTYTWDVSAKQRFYYRVVVRTIDSTQSLASTGYYIK